MLLAICWRPSLVPRVCAKDLTRHYRLPYRTEPPRTTLWQCSHPLPHPLTLLSCIGFRAGAVHHFHHIPSTPHLPIEPCTHPRPPLHPPCPAAPQLWDFRNNKCLLDYASHTKAITDVAFHPKYYVLVTASQDKSLHVLDLERCKQVGQVGPDTSAPRAIAFDQETRALVAHPDGLKVVSREWREAGIWG